MSRYLPAIALFVVLFLTVSIYLPSLYGGFLFDDIPNLAEMGKYGDMHQWGNASKFITHGIAGSTGRPISLLTFAPQADAWFAQDAMPFKVVNLVIHLFCGLLLYYVTIQLLKAYGYAKDKALWIALLSSDIWLIHPLFLSTVAYVIQRMAQLPLLFGLIAMIGYFKGREQLAIKPFFGYSLMTISIGLGTLLATFSKENGALLPLLILVIEFCNPVLKEKPAWQWRAVCLWLPSLAIIVFLTKFINLSPEPWPNRQFNQMQRLWTEGRIVVDYLTQLFIPHIEGFGLFQDGYLISTGWLTPVSTLFSILFLLALLVGAFVCRKKYPLITLAILFFFAAHLMESTLIGLELYFEHRNYVAAIFLFLPVAAGLSALSEKIKPNIVILVSVLILSMLAIMTWQRANLWSNTDKLQIYWAQNSPNSPRAQSAIAVMMMHDGLYQEADQVVEQALRTHPESGLLSTQLLLQKIAANNVQRQDFVTLRQQIKYQRADVQAGIAIRDLILRELPDQKIMDLYGSEFIAILNEMMANPSYLQIVDFKSYAMYLQGQILTTQKKPEEAYQHYHQSLLLSDDVTQGLTMTISLGNAGYLEQALKLLDETEAIYKKQPEKNLKRSKAYYEETIKQTRHDMQIDLQTELKKAKS
ncbi:MAG: hypothetical protein KGO49_10100 [Gammaproteobacteria bacterium]|nr:hypothetical protein [Gammaproteobacteria bacterium]